MQPLSWYARRLKSMPPREIVWRLRSAVRDSADRWRFALGRLPQWSPKSGALHATPPFRVFPPELATPSAIAPESARALLARADRLAEDRLDLFDLVDVPLGTPIDWQRDHASGKRGPLSLIHDVDYRDFAAVGDCKLVWEPNRHHQLVVLGRAYRLSGDLKYARAVARQLESWLEHNPFGFGMNWRSPLELGIRLINWVWALDLVRDSGAVSEELWRRVAYAAYLHCWEIQRKYSRFSSANNHLIGEAAGVFCACSYFDDMPHAAEWRKRSAAILSNEILAQTFPDGCTREHALGYQLFVMQFYVACLFVAEATHFALPAHFRQRLERMFECVLDIAAAGGTLPKIGDCDDGYVLDLGAAVDDMDTWRQLAGALFDRVDHVWSTQSLREPLLWLCDAGRRRHVAALAASAAPAPLLSRAFADSGYYLLQAGDPRTGDTVSVLFDCAELGYGGIAAHGHADALAFVLRAFGADVLVDAGTYDYFSFPEWRRYFRSTAAHNTVRVDGLDQSEMLGPFLWGRRAECSVERWTVTPESVVAAASHDGYFRRGLGVTHRREIALRTSSREIVIRDRLEGVGEHLIELFFHLAPERSAVASGEHGYTIHVGERRMTLSVDAQLRHELRRASDAEHAGWISSGYHRRSPSAVIIASARCALPVELTTIIAPSG